LQVNTLYASTKTTLHVKLLNGLVATDLNPDLGNLKIASGT
jgi:hypothetical protein